MQGYSYILLKVPKKAKKGRFPSQGLQCIVTHAATRLMRLAFAVGAVFSFSFSSASLAEERGSRLPSVDRRREGSNCDADIRR